MIDKTRQRKRISPAPQGRVPNWLLVAELAQDLQKKGYLGRTVGIKLRFDDFKTVTRDLTLADATAEAEAIRHAAGLCLKRVDFSRRIRLMGVRMGSLKHAGR